ncbi:MAG: PilZ domain-containing protein [Bdellovibrio sp.]|nr:PilZ domain-containing protein [Bdellovibrio sp.]
MWQNSNQKVRALAAARKRERDRARTSIHYKRINATVEASLKDGAEKSILEARVVLNDFSPKGVSFFSPNLLPQGLPVTLTTAAPMAIKLHGKVVYCQEANVTSHVIAAIHFGYRVGMEFFPENDQEREALTRYCLDLKHTFLSPR